MKSADDLLINIFFSGKATYYNNETDFGSGLLDCAKTSYIKCDWDSIFAANLPYNLSKMATNSLSTEISRRGGDGTVTWIDLKSYFSIVDYQLDISPYTLIDPLVTIINASLPNATNTTPLVINPDWVLAAWSVNDRGIINGTSSLGLLISSAMRDSIKGFEELVILGLIQISAMAQALTLIPYNTVGQHSSAKFSKSQISENIPLYFWRSRRVWLYSLKLRTAILGAVIITIGMIVVLMRTLLAIYEKLVHNYAARSHSLRELVVALLAHHPEEKLNFLTNESACVQVRFRVDDDGESLSFESQKNEIT